jgi:transposase
MSGKPIPKKRRKYDEDFKTEVLKMVANGKPVAEISQSLGIGKNIIYGWKSKGIQPSNALTKGKKEIDVWQEVERLRDKLRQTELERDIWTSRRCQSGPYSRMLVGWRTSNARFDRQVQSHYIWKKI